MNISQRQLDLLHVVEHDLASGSPHVAEDKMLLHAVLESIDPQPFLSRQQLIVLFEQGELDDEAVFLLFQDMIDDGTAWTIGGCYGEMADSLIKQGHCRLSVVAAARRVAQTSAELNRRLA